MDLHSLETERLRSFVYAGFDVIYRMNHDWSVMYELEGRGFLSDTPHDLRNWVKKYIPKDEWTRVSRVINKAIHGQTKFELEHKVICKDGTIGWCLSRAIPIHDNEGKVLEWFGALKNETREKQAEQELLGAREFSDKIIETLHEPLLVLSPDLEVKSANDAFYHDFKVNPENTVGRKLYSLGNGQWDIPKLRILLEDILPDNKHFEDYEVEHDFESLGRRTMLLNARRLDHLQLILLGIRDISVNREYDKFLRESEKRLRQMVNVEGIGVIIMNGEGILVDANESFLDISGYTRADIDSGRLSWMNLSPEKHRYLIEEQMNVMAKTGKIGPYEQEYLLKDGSLTWMLFAGASIGDGRFIKYCINISDRKKAEKALKESQRRMQFSLESVHMGSWETEEGSNVFVCDEGFRKLFGMTRDDVRVKLDDFYDLIHPADEQKVTDAVRKSWKEDSDLYIEFRVFIDGEEKWIAVRGRILSDNGQRKMIGVNYDVTDAKKTEAALKNAREEAEFAARAKEDFLAHMSHEIRTPLNVIIGLTHLLLELNPREDQLKNLNTLRNASNNLGTIINDILDYSKLKAGKIFLEEEAFSIEALIKDIISLHEVSANQRNLKLKWQMDPKINDFILADRLKLSQVLHNLLSNALKFTSIGEVSLDLELDGEKDDMQFIRFSVSDTGIGIPPNQQEEIFDLFSQGDSSTKRQYGGTGLGLAITRLYLQMMGSEIYLDSMPGKGSRFYFVVRAGKGEGTVSPPKKVKGNISNMKLLVVEDDNYNLMMIAQLLEQWGVAFDTAENGLKSIELARQNKYDLILMDIRMPEMDGYTATREIRKIKGYGKVPILALTADVSERVNKEIESGLMTDVSIKPVDPMSLKDTLVKYRKT